MATKKAPAKKRAPVKKAAAPVKAPVQPEPEPTTLTDSQTEALVRYAEAMSLRPDAAAQLILGAALDRVADHGFRAHELSTGPHLRCRRCGVEGREMLGVSPCV